MQDHLHPEVRQALELPSSERIAFCKADRWVGYTRAQQILKQLDDLFAYPKSLRMPNLLVVGRSDNGKSSIVQHFVQRHPILKRENGTPGPCIVWFGMPSTPTESNLSVNLCGTTGRGGDDRTARTPPRPRRDFDAIEAHALFRPKRNFQLPLSVLPRAR